MDKKHAQSIAKHICDNQWWDDLDKLLDNPVVKQPSTEREVIVQRLNYWINNYEGEICTEAPMYATMLGQQVMEIFDNAFEKVKRNG